MDGRAVDGREVVRRRLAANGLAGPRASTPEGVVSSLLAVQSQDVQPSAWSVAQRLVGGTEAVVEQARAEGRLLRTHVLRTTWHDVARDDLRWLLRLTGPRVIASTARARRELHLDDELLATARRAVESALSTDGHRTRPELHAVLSAAGLALDARALGYTLMHLELTGLVCSGERRGRWQTYGLLDERVPSAPPLDHEQAVAELVRRFLSGHGPAAVQDIAWWSSLLVSDVRAGLAALGDAVVREVVGDDLELWAPADAPPPAGDTGVLLVQVYDEHLVAFTRSKHLSDPDRVVAGQRPYLAVVLQDGCVAGSWGRTTGARGVRVHVVPSVALDPAALAGAVEQYGAFLGLPARLELG